MKTPKILSVTILRSVDTDPDTSYLGRYSDKPGPDDETVDRAERCDRGRNGFRYFIAANSAADTGNPDSVEQDYRRMESLQHGDWCYLVISASAEIVSANGIIQTVRSGGLWGIDGNSDESYLSEVEKDELSALRVELVSFGFADRAISNAFKTVQRKES